MSSLARLGAPLRVGVRVRTLFPMVKHVFMPTGTIATVTQWNEIMPRICWVRIDHLPSFEKLPAWVREKEVHLYVGEFDRVG